MSKNTNLPDTTSNNVSGSFTKNRLKFMIILVMQKIDTNQANKYDWKHQCYNQIYVIIVIHILLQKEVCYRYK